MCLDKKLECEKCGKKFYGDDCYIQLTWHLIVHESE